MATSRVTSRPVKGASSASVASSSAGARAVAHSQWSFTVGEVNLPGTRLFTGFVRDLTERQDRERRLSELQAELVHLSRVTDLGQMVSALAREVNQPLTALTNYVNAACRLIALPATSKACRKPWSGLRRRARERSRYITASRCLPNISEIQPNSAYRMNL